MNYVYAALALIALAVFVAIVTTMYQIWKRNKRLVDDPYTYKDWRNTDEEE